MPIKKRSHLILLLGILISVVSLWFALANVNIVDLYAQLTHSHYSYALPLLICFSLYYWLKAVRWQQLLRPIVITKASTIFSPMIIGFFGNNILPARLGEFIRMYLVANRLNVTKSQVLATIILERIFDILTIVCLLGVTILLNSTVSPILLRAGYAASFTGLCLLLFMTVYVQHTKTFLTMTNRFLFFLPHSVKSALLHHLEIGSTGLNAIRNPALLTKIIISSFSQWGLMGVTIYFSLLAVDISTPVAAPLVVLSFTVFAVIIPSTPGFFGTIQLAYMLALKPFGVSGSDAIAASIFFHVLTYFSVIFLGFYFLHKSGTSVHSLKTGLEKTRNP